MKKLIIIVFLFIVYIQSYANPIIYQPALITELYFDNNDNWTIEIKFLEETTDLTNYHLRTSNGTSTFKSGLTIPTNNILVITKDSLKYPIILNRDGGSVSIEKYNGHDWNSSFPELFYGNINNTEVAAPRVGQSIKLGVCQTPLEKYHQYYKSKTPDIGIFFINNGFPSYPKNSIINGQIFDANLKPISLNYINSTISPNSFIGNMLNQGNNDTYNVNLYPSAYKICIYDKQNKLLKDTTFLLEPDTTYIYNIYLDVLLTTEAYSSKKSEININNYPNPFSDFTTINIDIPENYSFKTGIVKIFNSEGEIISILPIDKFNKYGSNYNLKIDNSILKSKSGNYFCTLELDGLKKASCQISMTK